MILQISAGNGPPECELAVGKFLQALTEEFPDLQIVSAAHSKYAGCYKSVAVSTSRDISHLRGTVKWIAHSPFRPKHKRKNWFIDVCPFAENPRQDFAAEAVRFQTFHCGGPGGQNVNKVETGVRAIHVPTGLSVTSSEARSQYLNKKIALNRLSEIITRQDIDGKNLLKQTMWLQHEILERGNPLRTYVGMEFERKGI
jgi:peptide chain release factor